MTYLREPKFWASVVIVTVITNIAAGFVLRYVGNRPCDNC